ncbi:IS5 family transposase [Streptomyces sp. NBC_01221]|nr:IS5 family transposase [Streptomyces sp. NBC_01221]WSP60320.1 IS5 family transposase [Streptomyces sp. NBC_01241]WSP67206.1 IS5 family transposase [Streptomyces sp. NBC_01240]WSU26298.1 IS5 family transposase [Streptomyces sp. NBC_01108]
MAESLRGRKRLDERTVVNGIVGKFRTGTAWRDVPERHGRWATLHLRFRRWALDGTFERMLEAAQARPDEAAGIDWLVSVDSTVVRAHRHAPRVQKRGLCRPALGRSRGGLTSKIHLVCDAIVRPHAFTVTGGKRRNIVERRLNRLKQ